MSKRKLNVEEYTIGWVCALPIELAAAEEMLDEKYSPCDFPQDQDDTNLYTFGRVGDHNVVITSLPAGQVGTNAAAAVATQMRNRFRQIRFGLIVGIGGGVPSQEADIRLGDIVISQPCGQYGGVVQFDLGKTGTGGRLKQIGFLNTPPTILLNALARLRSAHFRGRSALRSHLEAMSPMFAYGKAGIDILFESSYSHAVEQSTCAQCDKSRVIRREQRDVQIHYGIIASGNQVMKDGVTRDPPLNLASSLSGDIARARSYDPAGLVLNRSDEVSRARSYNPGGLALRRSDGIVASYIPPLPSRVLPFFTSIREIEGSRSGQTPE